MDYITKALSRKEIRVFSRIFRRLFDVNNDVSEFPVLYALEKVSDVFKDTTVSILEDNELPFNVPARCYPNESGGFTIEIKNSVYTGAYEKKIGAYLGFICHEMCHIFLYKMGYTPLLERRFGNNELPAYESVEWQAKALCGEVMMPYEATKNMSGEQIMKRYHVSKGFVEHRRKY